MAFIQRTGPDTLLRSEKLPAIEIRIDPEFKYAGSTSFILYDVARVEQHHFVLADAERRVQRHLWFQFEGYLENNQHTYAYSGLERLDLNGFTFLHNTSSLNVEEDYTARPASDSAHVVDFLSEKGYLLTGEIAFHRLVWLDPDLRNELMIIYSEAFDAAEEWLARSRALRERSLSSFEIL